MKNGQMACDHFERKEKKWKKQADRPDSVTVPKHYDSHSSRRGIAPALKLPTHTLRGPHQCVPIWNCTRWRLPRFTVT